MGQFRELRATRGSSLQPGAWVQLCSRALRLLHTSYQDPIYERFLDEVQSPETHCAHGHRNIRVRGHHNYRVIRTTLPKGFLKFKTADAGEMQLCHNTSRGVKADGVEKLLCRPKAPDLYA